MLQDFRPDLVLYDAGVDPHHDDQLGRLNLTENGLMRREMQVCAMHTIMQGHGQAELHNLHVNMQLCSACVVRVGFRVRLCLQNQKGNAVFRGKGGCIAACIEVC